MEPKDFDSIDRNAQASVLAMRWLDNGQTLVEHKCASLVDAWREIDKFRENGDDIVAIKVDGNVIDAKDFGFLQQAQKQ